MTILAVPPPPVSFRWTLKLSLPQVGYTPQVKPHSFIRGLTVLEKA